MVAEKTAKNFRGLLYFAALCSGRLISIHYHYCYWIYFWIKYRCRISAILFASVINKSVPVKWLQSWQVPRLLLALLLILAHQISVGDWSMPAIGSMALPMLHMLSYFCHICLRVEILLNIDRWSDIHPSIVRTLKYPFKIISSVNL